MVALSKSVKANSRMLKSGELIQHWRQDPMYQQCLAGLRLCLKSPASALTILYLAAGFAGLLFNMALLASFGLDVLPYLEIADLLLAPLHYPQMLLYLLLSLLLFIAVTALGLWQSYRGGRQRAAHPYGWLIWPILLIYLVLAAIVPAKQRIEALKQGQGTRYQLQLIYPHHVAGGQAVTLLSEVQLISRTSVYWFVRFEQQIIIVPHANIATLQPLLPKKPLTSAASHKTNRDT